MVATYNSQISAMDTQAPVGHPYYNDSHRLFMQSMLSHRLLTEKRAQELYTRICEVTEEREIDFDEFVATINDEINEVDMVLRRSRDETNGVPVIALVNTKEDQIAQCATNYTPSEIVYFRQLLEMIVMADDETYAVATMVALRLGQKMKPPISQRDVQDLIDRLIEDGWLALSPAGSSYVMGTRSALELQSYLRDQYNDMIKMCKVCMEMVTMGERCERQDCPVRIHRHCADGLFTGNDMECPECKTGWTRLNTFGLGLPL
ncbi:hypothetical protein LRAMOSA01695 [Lichtheimia ramosa]|uniref:Non-structural maintenance of chromosomes element 1 homolog n=1 Tax=Lichtheimia ramosa TaxID=688394 RepID=A0A077WIX2_9FUNG|nr:hypothetical protein LRAMOSA01695 [Lichtheimia ramosa]